MWDFIQSVLSPQNIIAGAQDIYNDLQNGAANPPPPARVHGTRLVPGLRIRKRRVVRPVQSEAVTPQLMADPSTFRLDGAQWDSGLGAVPGDLGYPPKLAIDPGQDYGGARGRVSTVIPYRHMNAVLDAISNHGATRALAPRDSDPQDAYLGAQGAEQAMGETDRYLGTFRQHMVTPHLQAQAGVQPTDTADHQGGMVRMPSGEWVAYQSPQAQAARRRDYERALTAKMDAAYAGGQMRGYGTVPYAYMDGQMVDPDALQPRHDMTVEEASRLGQRIADIQKAGGAISNAGIGRGPLPDQNVVLSPHDTQEGTPMFRTPAGRAYVDANREAITQMENYVDPTTIPRLTLQGQGQSPAAAARQKASHDSVLAHYRGLRKQREDNIAALARRRRDAAEGQALAENMGALRGAGLEGRDALAAAMMGGLVQDQAGGGEAGNDRQQMVMDMLFPGASELGIRRQVAGAQIAKDQAETQAINDPMLAIARNLALNPNTDPDVQTALLQYIAQRNRQRPGAPGQMPVGQAMSGGGATSPEAGLIAAVGAGGQISALTSQLQSATTPEQILDLMANNPQLLGNPQLLARLYPRISGMLPYEKIGELLREWDPESRSMAGDANWNPYYRENHGWQNWIGRNVTGWTKAETEAEQAVRMKKVAILKKLQELAGGAPAAR